MDNIIVIESLTFKYDNIPFFNKLNLEVKKGSFTTILGPNGSGKSTLVKLILGLVKGNSVIMVDGLPVVPDNLSKIRKEIGVVFEYADQNFVAETVMDEIGFSLENLRMDSKTIKKEILHLATSLGIETILEKEPGSLNMQDKQLVSLASALIIKPKLLIIDEGLNALDSDKKAKVLSYIKSLNKKEKMTIVYITDDIEDCLLGDRIILLNKGKAVLSGTNEEVLENEEEFAKAKLELPFIIALSNNLKFYNLIDKTYFDEKELVNDLWP